MLSLEIQRLYNIISKMCIYLPYLPSMQLKETKEIKQNNNRFKYWNKITPCGTLQKIPILNSIILHKISKKNHKITPKSQQKVLDDLFSLCVFIKWYETQKKRHNFDL